MVALRRGLLSGLPSVRASFVAARDWSFAHSTLTCECSSHAHSCVRAVHSPACTSLRFVCLTNAGDNPLQFRIRHDRAVVDQREGARRLGQSLALALDGQQWAVDASIPLLRRRACALSLLSVLPLLAPFGGSSVLRCLSSPHFWPNGADFCTRPLRSFAGNPPTSTVTLDRSRSALIWEGAVSNGRPSACWSSW